MKLNPIYGLLLFTIICKSAFGQIEPFQTGTLPYDSSTSYLIEFDADRYDVSNSVNRSFIQKLLFGGHIGNDLKQSVADRFDGTNYYRGSMSPSFNFTLFPDSGKYGFTFTYRFTHYIDLAFRDDLFHLVFYGNSSFDDRLAFLTKSYLTYQNYHSLSFGLVDKSSGSFVNVGIYDGFNYRDYKLGSTSLVTEYGSFENHSFAETIKLNTSDTQFIESSKSYKPFGNGLGIGLSGAYIFESALGHQFRVAAQDVGVMYWKKLSVRDTSGYFEFNGFNFNPSDENGLNNVVESLIDSIVPTATIKNAWIMLPGFIRINYYAPAKKRFFATARAIHYYGRDDYTEFSADLNMKYGKRNILWITGGVGGYSTYIFGLGTEFSIFKNGVFKLGTRQVLGIFDPYIPASHVYIQYSHRL